MNRKLNVNFLKFQDDEEYVQLHIYERRFEEKDNNMANGRLKKNNNVWIPL